MAAIEIKYSTARTKSIVAEACFTWTIQNISFRLKDTKEIESTPFRTSGETVWSYCCLIGRENESVKFGLKANHMVYDQRLFVEVTFTIRKLTKEFTLPAGLDSDCFGYYGNVMFTLSSIKQSEVLEYAMEPGDTLTVVCRVRELLDITSGNYPIQPCQLAHDLGTILNSPQFTDVALIVEGQIIKAHKAILSARSPVFAAMFSTDMKELRQSEVTIGDMEYQVAQHLLRFIYTGKTEIEPDMADRVLVAADKYGLMRLKAQCERNISGAITTTTASKTLIFADRMNAEYLKSQTVAFIKANTDVVMRTDDWKTLIVEHPTLLLEACDNLANK